MRTTYELTASGKEFSFPFAADARLVTNKYDFMRVLHSVEGLCPKNPCCTPLLCLNSLFLFFSPAAFYAQGPRMDRQRVPSIFSSANSSFGTNPFPSFILCALTIILLLAACLKILSK